MPCQPSDPCFECPQCNEIVEDCLPVCPTPVYTTENCPGGTTQGSCVIVDNDSENCIGIIKNQTTLKSFITKLLVYLKLRKQLSNTDNSITITPIVDACNDKATIGVKISPDEGNQLTLLPNGLFVSTTPVSVVADEGSCIIVTPSEVDGQQIYTLSLDAACLAALLCPLCTTSTEDCLPPTNLSVVN
jgi:hypothetical protein